MNGTASDRGPSLWRTVAETPRIWAWEIAASLAVAAWFGVAGPFGSYEGGPLVVRLACFMLLSPAVTIWCGVVGRVAVQFGRERRVSPWLSLPLAMAVASGPASVVIGSVVPLFLPRASAGPVQWYLQTLAVLLPSGFVELLLRRLLVPQPAIAPPERGPARLTQRLRPGLGREVIALQAEDHYVRVFTPAGSDLLFMRLSDAIEELDGLDGVQTHRSWWVARCAVAAISVDGRRTTLRLANGQIVPVSRSAARQVRREF